MSISTHCKMLPNNKKIPDSESYTGSLWPEVGTIENEVIKELLKVFAVQKIADRWAMDRISRNGWMSSIVKQDFQKWNFCAIYAKDKSQRSERQAIYN